MIFMTFGGWEVGGREGEKRGMRLGEKAVRERERGWVEEEEE